MISVTSDKNTTKSFRRSRGTWQKMAWCHFIKSVSYICTFKCNRLYIRRYVFKKTMTPLRCWWRLENGSVYDNGWRLSQNKYIQNVRGELNKQLCQIKKKSFWFIFLCFWFVCLFLCFFLYYFRFICRLKCPSNETGLYWTRRASVEGGRVGGFGVFVLLFVQNMQTQTQY